MVSKQTVRAFGRLSVCIRGEAWTPVMLAHLQAPGSGWLRIFYVRGAPSREQPLKRPGTAAPLSLPLSPSLSGQVARAKQAPGLVKLAHAHAHDALAAECARADEHQQQKGQPARLDSSSKQRIPLFPARNCFFFVSAKSCMSLPRLCKESNRRPTTASSGPY